MDICEESINKVIKSLEEDFAMIFPNNFRFYNCELKTSETIMEAFFDRYFNIVEGEDNYHSKSVYTVEKMLSSLETENPIQLQETYEEYDRRVGKYNGYVTSYQDLCYWCPTTIKNTSDAFNIFYGWLTFNPEVINFLRSRLNEKNIF